MKNKKIYILFVISLILIIEGVILLFVKDTKEIIKEQTEYYNVKINDTISMCDTDKCPTLKNLKLYNLEYDTNIKEIQTTIKEINTNTKELYDSVSKSTAESEECKQYLPYLKHSLTASNEYRIYTGTDIISLSQIRTISNICTRVTAYYKPTTIIYDKVSKKVLTADEIIKKYTTNEEIEKAIKENIESFKTQMKKDYSYENTFKNGKQYLDFYIDKDNSLNVIYIQYEDNSYRIAKIKELK